MRRRNVEEKSIQSPILIAYLNPRSESESGELRAELVFSGQKLLRGLGKIA